jgi:methyl-accepting chemotaxis protein
MYGDTAAGRKRVAQLREQAGDVRALAARLVSQAEAVPWHGKAAEAMRERIRERAGHLRAAAAQHDTAAESLSAHVSEVDRLKEAIDLRSRKATTLVEDARTRASEGAAADDDAALVSFDPPPTGHRDWLTVELPGL